MKEKEFIINKITTLLYSFDIVSLEGILSAVQNLQKGKEEDAKSRAAKRVPRILNFKNR